MNKGKKGDKKKKKKKKKRNYAVLPMQISAVSILNFTHGHYSFSCFKTMNVMLIYCEKKVCMYYAFEYFLAEFTYVISPPCSV